MVQQVHNQPDASTFYIGGHVEMGPNVVVASGAVLEAAPGSRLVLESGVCVGSGVIIQAYGGDLVISADVNLGKEVLLVGTGKIGDRACIGAESTLINPQMDADQVVPARSLLGDFAPVSQNGTIPSATSNGNAATNGGSADPSDYQESGSLASANVVYGRDQVMQLVKTLFPHRNQLNSNSDSS